MTDHLEICPWTLLGVSPDADPATIRTAWRALVRRYHPDLAGTDRAAANRKLAEINAAYDVVRDPETARRKIAEARQAEAARRAEAARQAEAERRARAAETERRARAARAARAAAAHLPATRPAPWSPADLLAARLARRSFDRARRAFEGAPAAVEPATYA